MTSNGPVAVATDKVDPNDPKRKPGDLWHEFDILAAVVSR